MFGELTHAQIEQLLRTGTVGRIGCHAEGRTYVIPISYAYDNDCVYAQSIPGMKLYMMQLNPEVCFEVDQIKNASNWQSVVAWGTFEELRGDEATRALSLLIQRLTTLIASGQSFHVMTRTGMHETPREITSLYRIRLTEKTGRFEQDKGA